MIERYLPNYFNIDLEIPETYDYVYESSINELLDWEVIWTNITYSHFDLAMEEVTFELSGDENGRIIFDFPALKKFEISG